MQLLEFIKPLSLSFKVEYNYQVFFTESIFHENNTMLHNFLKDFGESGYRKKLILFVDQKVAEHHRHLPGTVREYFKKNNSVDLVPKIFSLPGGEHSKNNSLSMDKIVKAIDRYGIDRHSFVAAIGGGAFLDMVGYASSVSHRGVKHIRIPTTVLSQNDAGIGVKNGINYEGKKNFLGSFAPPVAVFNDYRFLETLDDRDWRSGMAEAVKVALIKDEKFFVWLEKNTTTLIEKNKEAMQYLIYRCAELHLEHIANGDPFEKGSSRPLDFGHWMAHKLESLTSFSIRHGEAVAIGIALDSVYSNLIGLLSKTEMDRIIQMLLNLGFDLFHPMLAENNKINIWNGLNEFREHLGGRLTVVLLEGIGKGKEVNDMNFDLVKQAIDALQTYNQDQKIKNR